MEKIVELEEGVFVASQLVEDDFARISARGLRAVVANRPDGEASGQLSHEEAEAAARRHGLEFRYHPVPSFNVTDDEEVEAFARAITELEGPVLFYCRTGNRSTILWALASVERLGVSATLAIAKRAGYDLDNVRMFLEERAGRLAA